MSRSFQAFAIIATVLLPIAPPSLRPASAQPACTFQIGFAVLRGRLPEIVGECMRPERVNPASGDLEQQTTGGLLVRRQADGFTTFTDGKTTWINGPTGLVSRPNEGPLFPWEAGAAPVGPDGLRWAPRAAGEFVYGALLADPAGNATLAKAAGFSHMWAHVAWRQVEPAPGEFLFRTLDRRGRPASNDLTNVVAAALEADLRLVLRVADPPEWAGGVPALVDPLAVEAFVEAAVAYAGGVISHVEVFNEPNLPREWGAAPDPAGYARLLEAAYRGAKRADPTVQVIAAGVSARTGGHGGTMEDVDFLEGLYQAGAQPHFDLLGLHPYVGFLPPETGPACTPLCFRTLELWRAVMERHGDAGKGAFITELGTLEHTPLHLGGFEWMKLAPDRRAEYLVRALRLANANYPWIRGAMIFNLDYAATPWNPPTSEHYWFSLLNPDRSPRPAYEAFWRARRDGTLP